MSEPGQAVVAVVIGRNEGERLRRCLSTLTGHVACIVYVDSGSTDGSVQLARSFGAEVVELDLTQPFTAARARNAGLERYSLQGSTVRFVQFVDGDCEIRSDWIPTATRFLDGQPRAAAVAGRLRERYPDLTIFNRLADAEWNRPTGKTDAVGGIAMMRLEALSETGAFDPELIAGEEPELCLRLRRRGWEIWQLADEMGYHDIAMTRFSQWWKRTRRAGHAYAEGAARHGSGPERYCVAETRRALIWGAMLPLAALIGAIVTPWALLLLLAVPAQILRLRLRGESWLRAAFLTIGKLPEAHGAVDYHIDRLVGRRTGIIEYK